MLHIVNKSHSRRARWTAACAWPRPGSALLLTEDGVYAATQRRRRRVRGIAEAPQRLKVYALQPDLEARGMAGKLVDGVTAVDYGGFVDLVAEHPTSQSWL